MLALNLKHVGKPSIFPCLLFSPTSYYFRSWKTFWDIKDVYKMKKEVERRFLRFSGFGWKFRLACSFYGHKGISMSLYLSEFGRNSPRFGKIEKLLDWVPSMTGMKWLWVFCPVNQIWVGHFPSCDLQWGEGEVSAPPMAISRGLLLAPYTAGFCVHGGEGAPSPGTRCGWWGLINPTQKAQCSAERVSNVAL